MLPELFLNRMQKLMGEEYEVFLTGFEKEKYQALRLNGLKKHSSGRTAADLAGVRGESQLQKGIGEKDRGIQPAFPAALSPVPWAQNGYYYEKEDQPGKHPYHEAGVYYIQEPSAMAPVTLLDVQPGERILDLCAAPGGKSTQIAAALQGEGLLVCNEIHPARAKILSENVERMGICNACVTNETPQRLSQVFIEYFDRILVDAPCSGEGMFRKNEAACEEWSPENVELCAERQDEILDCAAKMLRPGGRLVYSTCTFAPLENEGSISRFIQRNPEFGIVPIDKQALFCGELTKCSTSENISEAGKTEGGKAEAGKAEAGKAEVIKAEDGKAESHNSLWEQGYCDGRSDWVEEPASGLEHTLRLWPHRLKGEGHYAAVLQKAGEVPEGYSPMALGGTEKGVGVKELGEFPKFVKESLKSLKSRNNLQTSDKGRLWETVSKLQALQGKYLKFGDNIYLVPDEMPAVKGLKVLRPGLHVGTLKKNRFEPSHALALALSAEEAVHVWNLSSGDSTILAYLNGQTFPAEGEKGWYLICVDGFSIGWGKLAGGMMKNHYPKGLRKNC